MQGEQRHARHFFQVQADGIVGSDGQQIGVWIKVIELDVFRFLIHVEWVAVHQLNALAMQCVQQCLEPLRVLTCARSNFNQVIHGQIALDLGLFQQRFKNAVVLLPNYWCSHKPSKAILI